MSLPLLCPSCGMPNANLTVLPDGTLYCNVERIPVTTSVAGEDVSPFVPEVQTAAPPTTEVPQDDAHWMDATHEAEASPVVVLQHPEPAASAQPEPESPHDEVARKLAEPVATADVTDDDDGPNTDAIKLVIGLCLSAGLMSLTEDNEPLEPPTAWAPPPADQVPEFAAGCALAVALLIRTCGIDHNDVRALARQFIDTDTTEGSE